MSKRSDSIRSMFAIRPTEALSADNKAPASSPRVPSSSVRSMRDSFSDFERENENLRAQLALGLAIVEVDPGLIDPSPVTDRFIDSDPESYEGLKLSIEQRGQEIPVLLREHPAKAGRYQSAYGHRRIRVARELGRLVKAIIRVLSDEDLVVAQGVENSARQDLTFIERAVFASRLEDAGHDRRVVQEALSVDKAEASKLIAVARAIPSDIVDFIGRAPKVGRFRWQAFAETLSDKNGLSRARAAVEKSDAQPNDSDGRFLLLLSAISTAPATRERKPTGPTATARSGKRIARLVASDREVKLVVERDLGAQFGAFLIAQLPDLYETYAQSSHQHGDEDAV